jgi:hypothetical protein
MMHLKNGHKIHIFSMLLHPKDKKFFPEHSLLPAEELPELLERLVPETFLGPSRNLSFP